MKLKKFKKKLILNKKTIADLNNKDMKDVLGRMADITALYTNCDSAKLACHCAEDSRDGNDTCLICY